jgi:hypothetical protein
MGHLGKVSMSAGRPSDSLVVARPISAGLRAKPETISRFTARGFGVTGVRDLVD